MSAEYIPAHKPVLVQAFLEYMAPDRKSALLIDSTLGEGGHTEVFLNSFKSMRVIGVEADPRIAERAAERLGGFKKRFRLFRMNFTEFYENYSRLTEEKPDRIFFDLGISMFHYKESGRGFSFDREEPLDMRLSPEDQDLSAADIVNTFPEEELADLIYEYGEERYSRRIARNIIRERSARGIKTSSGLAEIIRSAVPPEYRRARLHPATRTFQALRIRVNNELDNLRFSLDRAFDLLAPGGRMGVISFHSLEDRIVKRFFREKNRLCICPPEVPICQCRGRKEADILTKKPVEASAEEKRDNPASRSARLRAAVKL